MALQAKLIYLSLQFGCLERDPNFAIFTLMCLILPGLQLWITQMRAWFRKNFQDQTAWRQLASVVTAIVCLPVSMLLTPILIIIIKILNVFHKQKEGHFQRTKRLVASAEGATESTFQLCLQGR